MKRISIFGGMILFILIVGYPFANELIQLNAEKKSKSRFQKTIIESNLSSDNPVSRQNKHWKTLPDDLRTELRELGFYPADLPAENRQFELKSLDGKTYNYTSKRGSWVLINFWATWCPPCRTEMPSLDKLRKNFTGSGLSVITINVQQSESTIEQFKQNYGFELSVLLDKDGDVTQGYGATGLPETWLISPDGDPIAKIDGPLEWHKRTVQNLFKNLVDLKRND